MSLHTDSSDFRLHGRDSLAARTLLDICVSNPERWQLSHWRECVLDTELFACQTCGKDFSDRFSSLQYDEIVS